jgi:hypothetical protein
VSRAMVGLLAAAGATMSALAGLLHGRVEPAMIAGAGVATGLAAYLGFRIKKSAPVSLWVLPLVHVVC